MKWNYRVVREAIRRSKLLRGRGPDVCYSILEVYYDQKGDEIPTSWIEEKAHLCYLESLDSLETVLYEYLPVALKKPVLYKTEGDGFVLKEEFEGLLSKKDRLRGCLLGCAVGDALGVPLEKRDAETVKKVLPEGDGKDLHFYEVPWTFSEEQEWRHGKGQYSDDTQLMKMVLETVRDCDGTFDPDTYCQKLISLYDSGNPIGFGKGTSQSIERLKNGTPWSDAGSPPPSAGNGAAMKAAIFGCLFDDLDTMIQSVIESSLPTHKSKEALAGAVAVASMAWHLRYTESRHLDEGSLLRSVAESVEDIYEPFAADLDELSEIWDTGIPDKESLLEWTLKTQPPTTGWPGISPYVRPTVLWSFNAFLLEPNNYLKAVKIAMSSGGDVDTVAAITGALSGSFNGLSAIPDDLIEGLNDCGRDTGKELIQRCDETYEILKGK